jgi:predicted Rossmann fold flavoprotein
MSPPPHHDADLVIVGAGAAGLMAAIAAARAGRGRVVVLDGAARLGAKILISGGGRCNVTNAHVGPADFNGGARRAIGRVLKAFSAGATIRFFEDLGVSLHEEARGKLFPDANTARSVLDALVGASVSSGGDIRPGHRVESMARVDEGFEVVTPRGTWRTPRVVVATGGLSVPRTGSDGHGLRMAAALGHTIVPTTPALVPLLLGADSFHARVSGVSHDVVLEAIVDGALAVRVHGPLLWTHQGVSGPAALDLSRHWHRAVLEGREVHVRANLCGGAAFDEVDERVARAKGRTLARTALEAWMPASVAAEVMRVAGIEPATPAAQLPREARRRLVHLAIGLPLAVTGSRGYSHAEATAGGVSLDEIDPATMASRVCPGLFLAGEMLDVDGRLGGFNFQWAWSSGCVAGRGATGPSG